jgi:hypothetical protein
MGELRTSALSRLVSAAAMQGMQSAEHQIVTAFRPGHTAE